MSTQRIFSESSNTTMPPKKKFDFKRKRNQANNGRRPAFKKRKYKPFVKRPAREKPDLKLRNQNSELFIVKLPKRSMEFLKYKNKTAEFKANPLVVGTLTTCEDPSDGPAFLKFSESTKSKCEHELSDLQFTFTRREHAERVFFVSRNKEQKCAVQGYVKGQFRGQRSFGVGMLRKTSVKDAGASSLKFVEDGDVTETQNNVLMFNEEIPAMKLNRKDAEGSGVNTYPKSGTWNNMTMTDSEILGKLLDFFERDSEGFTKNKLMEMLNLSEARLRPSLERIAMYSRAKKKWVLKSSDGIGK